MPQDIINLIISGAAGILGWLMRIVWETQREQRAETKALTEKVNGIEVVVAGQYVRRDELAGILARIDGKLDAISTKLDGKADR
jgi:Flp pilus assembly protein CpaB